jgi:L-ascorbate metabolism protein UlaG (beta-lactamase superfamily)
MDIKYFGHSSFFLKGKTATVVTDPFDPQMVGLKFPKIEADVVTISHQHQDHNQAHLVGGNPLVIDIPGEYEKQGIKISGFPVYHDQKQGAERGKNTLFKIEADNLSLLHCGDLGHVLSDEIIEEINGVDVLLIPVGGFYTIDPDEAAAIVRKIEPSIVIPMHYNTPRLNQQQFGKLAPVSEFLSKIGGEETQPIKKLSVKKEELGEEMKMVVMEISS